MTKVLVSVLAAGAMLIGSAAPAFATGKIYGNYGQGAAPQNYGAPGYGPPPSYDGPYRGAPVYAERGYRDCRGESVAGTIIGGVLGGVIGSNLGRGHHRGWYGHHYSNRGPATVAGVLLGSVAGNAIATSGCDDGRAAYGPSYGYAYGPQYGYAPGYAYGPGYDDEDEYYDDEY